jgi:hypothetical protein
MNDHRGGLALLDHGGTRSRPSHDARALANPPPLRLDPKTSDVTRDRTDVTGPIGAYCDSTNWLLDSLVSELVIFAAPQATD